MGSVAIVREDDVKPKRVTWRRLAAGVVAGWRGECPERNDKLVAGIQSDCICRAAKNYQSENDGKGGPFSKLSRPPNRHLGNSATSIHDLTRLPSVKRSHTKGQNGMKSKLGL